MAQSLWQEAEEVFNTLLMRPPVKAKYHVMLSVIGVHTKRLEAALAHLNQALVIDPQEPMLYTQKGQLLKAMGQWELALA